MTVPARMELSLVAEVVVAGKAGGGGGGAALLLLSSGSGNFAGALPPVFVLPDALVPERTTPTEAIVSNGSRSFLAAWNRMPATLPSADVIAAPRSGVMSGPVLGDPVPNEPTTVTSARAESVPTAIERLQQTDVRFGQIAADFRDGTVILRGNRNDASTVMAFARLLSDVPGVERIVLQNPKMPQP